MSGCSIYDETGSPCQFEWCDFCYTNFGPEEPREMGMMSVPPSQLGRIERKLDDILRGGRTPQEEAYLAQHTGRTT